MLTRQRVNTLDFEIFHISKPQQTIHFLKGYDSSIANPWYSHVHTLTREHATHVNTLTFENNIIN